MESRAVVTESGISTWAYRGFWMAPVDDANTSFTFEVVPDESDAVDPSEWDRIVAYLSSLPHTPRIEPDDVEPFV